MQVTPDSAHRIVLTKEIRNALNLKSGEPIEVSLRAGAVLLTPVGPSEIKIASKGKLKVYTGAIPDVDIEKAIAEGRERASL